MSDEHLEKTRLECTVAAILTIAVIGSDGNTPERAVSQYARVLAQLRTQGGVEHPTVTQ